MSTLRDLCMELRKKKKYTLKEIANGVGIPVYVLKGSIYQGTRPQGENVYKRLCKYFEKELGRPITEISFEKCKGRNRLRLIERVKELISQMGETKITKVLNDIARETTLSLGTLEKWCYLDVSPKVEKLKELADYFTKKLGREVTVDYLLGKQSIEPVKEETLEDIIKHLELALSALKRAQVGTVDDQEKQILEIFRKLPPVKREDVLSFLKFKLQWQ